MKKQFYISIIAIIFGSYVLSADAKNDISSIFKTGMSDINIIAGGYLMPAGKAFSNGMTSDWYNTAEVHSPLGFDLTFEAGAILIPSSDQTFKLSGLTNLKPSDPNIIQAPTFGGGGNGVELNLMQPKYLIDGILINPLWNNGTGTISSFTTPDGVSKQIPTASVRLTVGLPFSNDVSIRFLPKVLVSGFGYSSWGIGLKHNFKQWIPSTSILPFEVALMLSYSRLDINYAFPDTAQITPSGILGAGLEYTPDFPLNIYSTQAMKIDASAMTANIIFSKNIGITTPYLGLGLSKTTSDLTMIGVYPMIKGVIPILSGTSIVTKMQIENVTNPIHITSNEIQPNMTLGLRLKALELMTFHAQYSLQKYSVASAAIGFTFR